MRKGIDCRGREWEEYIPTKTFAKDMYGQRFGRLAVLFRVQNTKSGDAQWLCLCDCGNEIVVKASSLRGGHSKSCGCYHRDAVSEKLSKPFAPGEQIGYWTVMYRAEGYIGKGAYWHCRCRCGVERDICAEHLRLGLSLSCGCMQREFVSVRQLIDLTGLRFGKLVALRRSDKKVIGDVYWVCACDCGNVVEVSGHNLRRGTALSCGCISMSNGEYVVSELLKANDIQYVYNRGYFTDLKGDEGIVLRYDFVLLDDNNIPYRIIEFDGKQHTESVEFFGGDDALKKTRRNDEIKNQYALAHNIPLIRIPYSKKQLLHSKISLEINI